MTPLQLPRGRLLEIDILKDPSAVVTVLVADNLVYGVEASIESAFTKAVTHVDST